MPSNSLIVGVDLAPIKPIPRTITFQSDINSDKCRATIRSHLKTWRADTVLHDGAPNVGTAWTQDAFTQAELTLQAMKLATEFLRPGGTFVTKVFRSKDYNSLLWVFNQLFERVEATKPPSSRTVSAEIFVVCQGFKAPHRIDPRFLDARSVFADLANLPSNSEARVFNPEQKRRRREGYDNSDLVQFRETTASNFVAASDPIAVLGSTNKLTFEQPPAGDIALAALERLPETTPEIRHCCSDLKLLGRKDFRTLLRWRLKVRTLLGFNRQKPSVETKPFEVAEISVFEDGMQPGEELRSLTQKEALRRKKERRRENERKRREVTRLQMHMQPPTDIGLDHSGIVGPEPFLDFASIGRISHDDAVESGQESLGRQGALQPLDDRLDSSSDSDSDNVTDADSLDGELELLYGQYVERKRSSKDGLRLSRRAVDNEYWSGFSSIGSDSESESGSDGSQAKAGGRTATYTSISQAPLNGFNLPNHPASTFFNQEIFQGIEDQRDMERKNGSNAGPSLRDKEQHALQAAGQLSYSGVNPLAGTQSRLPPEDVQLKDDEDLQRLGKTRSQNPIGMCFTIDSESIPPRRLTRADIDIITAEAMTIAQQMVSGSKQKQEVVDDSFNKHSFYDRSNLPSWFNDDEKLHSTPRKPITAAAAAAIREKARAFNARPIKKVREAKDRKRNRALRRLERLRKKSAVLADDDASTEKDKARSIAKLMARASKRKPQQGPKVVVARGPNRAIPGRPRGVKGKYKIVDARLKKDLRAAKRLSGRSR